LTFHKELLNVRIQIYVFLPKVRLFVHGQAICSGNPFAAAAPRQKIATESAVPTENLRGNGLGQFSGGMAQKKFPVKTGNFSFLLQCI